MPARLVVPVRVIPRAREDRVDGMRAGRLVIRVSAPPEGGAANRAATAVLAKGLGLRRADIQLESGSSSRDKTFSIPTRAQAAFESLSTSATAAGGTAGPEP